MLNQVRNLFRSLLVKILVGLLLISFLFWGVGEFSLDLFINDDVATIDDSSISIEEYQQQISRQINAAGLGNRSFTELRDYGFFQSVLENMITDNLLAQQATRLGIDLTTIQAQQIIRSQPQLRDESGNFSAAKLREVLISAQISEQQLITQTRSSFRAWLIANSMQQIWPQQPQLAQLLWQAENQLRDASLVALDLPTVSGDPTSSALQAIIDNESVTIPEQRQVHVLQLAAASIASRIEIEEQQLNQYYEQIKDNLGIPETRTLRIQTFAEPAIAQQQYEQISSTGSLSEQDSVEYQQVTANQLRAQTQIPELVEIAFASFSPGLLPPFSNDFATFLIEVESINPGETPSYASVRPQLLNDLQLEAAQDLLYENLEIIDDAVVSGRSWNELLPDLSWQQALELPLGTAPDTRAALASNGIPDADAVAEAIFSNSIEAQQLQLVAGANDRYYLFSLEGTTPARPATVANDRALLETVWRAAERDKLAAAMAQPVIAAFPAGNVTSKLTKVSDLQDNNQLPAAIRTTLFQLTKPGDIAFTQTDGNIYIVRLDAITHPEQASDWPQVVQRRQQTALLDSYLQNLRNSFRITRNPEVIERAISFFQ